MAFWLLNLPDVPETLDDLTGNLSYDRLAGKKIARVAVATDYDIPYAGSEISGFRKTVYTPENGIAYLTYAIDMSHRGVSAGSPNYDPPENPDGEGHMPAGSYYPIGISSRVCYRRAATEMGLSGAFTNLNDTISAGQLSDRKQHYQTISDERYPFAVDGGYYYQFSLFLSSHTDAGLMNGVDGAAELTTGGGRNYLLIEYEPGTISVD